MEHGTTRNEAGKVDWKGCASRCTSGSTGGIRCKQQAADQKPLGEPGRQEFGPDGGGVAPRVVTVVIIPTRCMPGKWASQRHGAACHAEASAKAEDDPH
jgi:hypothetical protein